MNTDSGKVIPLVLVLTFSLILFGSVPATAGSDLPHWYVGGGFGSADLDKQGVEDEFESASGVTTTSFDLDDESTWRFFGGYQFNPWLGVELGYEDFDEMDFNGNPGSFNGQLDLDGFTLTLTGQKTLIGDLYGFAEAGLFRWESKLSSTSGGRDNHGGDLTFGAGLGYSLSSDFDVRAQWNRYEALDEDLDVISANLVYHFDPWAPKQQPPTDDGEERRLREQLTESQRKARQREQRIQELQNQLNQKQSLKETGTQVEEEKDRFRLILPNRVLFESGQASITPEGQETLTKVAEALKDYPSNPIRVEGHTDTVPISTDRYPSNWELSSARATNVVKYLVDQHGINPGRIAAVAHGEHQPRVPNTSPENRRKNRRVEIEILKNPLPEQTQ